MANKGSLIQGLRAIRKAFNCPTCGKSRLVAATSHRGRGTGQRGESHYDATSFENVSPETHCACPGGPAHREDAAAQE